MRLPSRLSNPAMKSENSGDAIRNWEMTRPRVVPQPNKNKQLAENYPTPVPNVFQCLFFAIVQPQQLQRECCPVNRWKNVNVRGSWFSTLQLAHSSVRFPSTSSIRLETEDRRTWCSVRLDLKQPLQPSALQRSIPRDRSMTGNCRILPPKIANRSRVKRLARKKSGETIWMSARSVILLR